MSKAHKKSEVQPDQDLTFKPTPQSVAGELHYQGDITKSLTPGQIMGRGFSGHIYRLESSSFDQTTGMTTAILSYATPADFMRHQKASEPFEEFCIAIYGTPFRPAPLVIEEAS